MSTEEIILTRPPVRVFQADRIHYRVATPYLASDGWSFKVAFITNDQAAFTGTLQTILTPSNAVSEVSPGTWDVDLDSSDPAAPSTQAWQVGLYHWAEFVEKSGADDRVTLRRGTMLLEIAYGSGAVTSTGMDLRSWARISLENIEAVLQTKASRDQKQYQIAGRSLERYDFAELVQIRNWLRAEVDAEDALEAIASGQTDVGDVLVEF